MACGPRFSPLSLLLLLSPFIHTAQHAVAAVASQAPNDFFLSNDEFPGMRSFAEFKLRGDIAGARKNSGINSSSSVYRPGKFEEPNLLRELSGARKFSDIQRNVYRRRNVNRLFVFGDSYVDNGNRNKSSGSVCWQHPYGATWPGRPSGRCSDGLVLSDWLAKLFDFPAPISFRELSEVTSLERKSFLASQGINFAVAGSGVFRDFGHKTFHGQIGWLKKLLNAGIVKREDLESTLFLVSTSSNDYYNFVQEKSSPFGLPTYISKVVDGLGEGIENLSKIGAKNLIISNLFPLGCLPAVKEAAHVTDCFSLGNLIPNFHNLLLKLNLKKWRNNLSDTKIVLADLNKVFNFVGLQALDFGFDTSFEACCDVDGGGVRCGTEKESYILCQNPSKNFFWDAFHLTQAGHKVASQLLFEGNDFTEPKPNLKEIFEEDIH